MINQSNSFSKKKNLIVPLDLLLMELHVVVQLEFPKEIKQLNATL
uniref:Uncharacterized protein n=1 Tax=viral metagenome TaxID=1070528 RepID=A0A6C0EFQ7_9ZZZZ